MTRDNGNERPALFPDKLPTGFVLMLYVPVNNFLVVSG